MRRWATAALFCAAVVTVAAAQSPVSSLSQLYQQLERPPLAQGATVAEAAFSWAGLRFLLQNGELVLTAPVAGQVTAAVFTGHGVLQVLSPNPIERQQMERFTGRSEIAVGFTQAVFRFADGGLFQGVLGKLSFGSRPSDRNAEHILEDRAQAIEARGSPALVRLLQALQAGPASHLLLAELKMQDGHWLSVQFDPTLPEPLRVFAWAEIPNAGGAAYPDVWTQFAPGGEPPQPPPLRLDDYRLNLELSGGLDLDAAARFRVATANSGRGDDRVDSGEARSRSRGGVAYQVPTHRRQAMLRLPSPLDRFGAADGAATPGAPETPAFRGGSYGSGRGRSPRVWEAQASEPILLLSLDRALRLESVATAAGAPLEWLQPRHGDWVAVRLPPTPGRPIELELRYRGKPPLLRDPDNNATSLPGWVPTALALPGAPPAAPAHFDLHFTANRKYLLLATGERVAIPVPAGDNVSSEWRSPSPLRAAGFAVGESQLTERTLALADGRSLPLQLAVPRRRDPEALTPLAGAKLTDILNFMGTYFGPYPYPALAATVSAAEPPDPLPMLVTLDPQAFLDTTPDLTQVAPAASVAGQWWGAWTAPATPQDEWLIAGLRAASGLLYQQTRSGPEASLPMLRQWRQALLQPARLTGHIPVLAGPLSLGAARLGSNLDDGGQLLTLKGAYAIYMLRQMMLEPNRPNPDAAFIAMMRDFSAHDGGHSVTSAEFQAVVEKHMTPLMNLDGNHKMDWFFRPLLQGTGVPQLTFHAEAAAAVKGIAQVKLTVDNPQHWRGLLPVYFFQNANAWLRGMMPVTQDHQTLTVPVPFAPQYVEANHFLDMLVEVRQ